MRVLLLVIMLCIVTGAVWAQGTTPAADPMGDVVSPWHDAIHWVGLANAALALLALLGGVVLFAVFELRGVKFTDPARKQLRLAHMIVGTTAIAAGLAHYIGRGVQVGEYFFGVIPPALCMYGFLLVLLTGWLRYRTPKALRKFWRYLPWLHRLGVVVALYYLTRHSLYQYHKFMGGGGHEP